MLVAGCSPTVVGCTPWLLDAVGAHHRATSWGRLRAGPLPLHTPKAETEASPHPYLNLFTWLYERLAPLIIMRCRIPWVQRQGRRATEIDTGQAVRLVTVACSLLIGRKLTGFLSVINRERKKNKFFNIYPSLLLLVWISRLSRRRGDDFFCNVHLPCECALVFTAHANTRNGPLPECAPRLTSAVPTFPLLKVPVVCAWSAVPTIGSRHHTTLCLPPPQLHARDPVLAAATGALIAMMETFATTEVTCTYIGAVR